MSSINNIITVFILTCFLGACSRSSDSGSRDADNQKTNEQTSAAESSSEKSSANQIVEKINSKKISLKSGLDQLTVLVQTAGVVDTLATPVPEKEIVDNAVIQDIATAVFDIKEGNPVQNLAAILVKESYAGQDDGKNMISGLSTVADLFQVLSTHAEIAKENIEFDEFLISFLFLYSNNYAKYQDEAISEDPNFEKIKKYFELRIQKFNQKNDSAESITENFKVYACLIDIIKQADWLRIQFGAQMDKIDVETLKSASRRNYFQILQVYLGNSQVKISTHVLQNAVRVLQDQLSHQFWNDDTASFVELVSLLFDQPLNRYEEIAFADWVVLMDTRIEAMRSFESLIRNLATQDKLPNHGGLSFSDPLAYIYFERGIAGLSNISQGLIIRHKSLLDALDDFDNRLAVKLNYAGEGIPKVRLHSVAGLKNLDLNSELKINLTMEMISGLNNQQRIDLYRNYLMAVEVSRHYFETNGNKSNPNVDFLRLETQALRAAIAEGLCVRYFEKMKGRYNCDSYKNPNIAAYDLNSTYQLLDGINAELDNENKIQRIKYNKLKPVSAGIYIADTDMELEAARLVFHPLAMIYAPGKSITIKSDNVSGLLVDVSSENIENDNKIGVGGRTPNLDWYNKNRGIERRPYNVVHEQCPIDVPSQRHYSISFWSRNYWIDEVISIDEGQQPDRPMKSKSAKDAGRIQVLPFSKDNHNAFWVHNSLLFSFGGNGQRGYAGAESPLCRNGQYQSYHNQFCTSFGYGVTPQADGSVLVTDRSGHTLNNKLRSRFIGEGENRIVLVTFDSDVSAGAGGDGGNGGNSGVVDLRGFHTSGVSAVSAGGRGGYGGHTGLCGPGNSQGNNGERGNDGGIRW